MNCTLPLKVVPGSSRDSVQPFADGLKIKVTAAPEKGKANRAVEKLLAALLQLPASEVRITSGLSSQQKQVRIEGLDREQVLARLGQQA